MNSKKLIFIFVSLFVMALVTGTFLFLYLNKDQNQVSDSKAYSLPTASVFKVDPFPVPASGHYTSEKNGDWDFASQDQEGWIKVKNNASTTRKIGWQIDCRPDQPGGQDCWDNAANPKGEITVGSNESWEVLVGRLCLPYQLDFTGPDFGRYIAPDTSKCNATGTPRPTPTTSPSPTNSPSGTPRYTPSNSPTPTPTRSASATPSRTPTATPTASPTGTPPVGGPSNTPTPSPTPTNTPAPSSSSTSTPAPSSSASSTPVVAQSSSTPTPDRVVADATTLPQAGVNDGVMYAIIAVVALLVSGVFALMKKKYY